MEDFMFQLDSLFNSKGWNNEEISSSKMEIIKLAINFEEEERVLLLNLLQDFKIIKWQDYDRFLKIAIRNIPQNETINLTKMTVLPLKSEKDKFSSKSSDLVWYSFKDNGQRLKPELQDIKIIAQDNYERISTKLNNHDYEKIILVDDFIGTGETVLSCLKRAELKNINKDKIIILSIAAMADGIKKINNYGVNVFCYKILDKGIASIYDIEIKNKYYKIMRNIENKYNIPENISLGYGHSEALVKLCRTPNNTFPIFWNCNMKNVIFPRY
jgi:hypothetical protein